MPPTDQAKEHLSGIISCNCQYVQCFMSHNRLVAEGKKQQHKEKILMSQKMSADLICVKYLAVVKVSMGENPVNSTTN